MSERPTCNTCRFKVELIGLVAECHRHAPVAGSAMLWPLVNSTDWCGEYESSEPSDCPRCDGEGALRRGRVCTLCRGTGVTP